MSATGTTEPTGAGQSAGQSAPPQQAPPPSLTSLRAFSAVGQCQSFTKAAQQLGVTQSAISRQIKLLEEALDITLFHRIGNSISLTPEGASLHQRVFETFGLLDEAVAETRAISARQRINLLAPPTFAARWLTRRLHSFRERFPAYDLAVYTRPHGDIRMDCSVRFGIGAERAGQSTQLLIEQHMAVCAPSLRDDPKAMADSCLFHVLDEEERLPLWDDWFAVSGQARGDFPETSLDFATLEMAIEAAKNGAGLAIVDRHMIEYELAAGSLVPIDQTVVTGPRGYWLEISSEQQARTRSVQFVNWLRSE
ncbi:MAG: LysR family transcriptional regulator [Alphaproteobacteria bacterium]|nr:LysR family transcriptional regulator [Alphaproteobacteria bacterium SS10]